MIGQFRQMSRDREATPMVRIASASLFSLLTMTSVSFLAGCAQDRSLAESGTVFLGQSPAVHTVQRPLSDELSEVSVFSNQESSSSPDDALPASDQRNGETIEPLPESERLMVPPAPRETGATEWMGEELFPTQALRLSEVLMLLRESPRMAALRSNINIMQAERIQAGLLPNPEFSYSRYATMTGDSDAANDPNEYTLAQPLLLFGQRDAAIRTADLEISATQAEVFADYADLVVKARRSFASMLVSEEVVRVLRESLEHFERVERLIEGRFEEGDVSEYDLERIRVEVATFRSQLVTARAKLAETSGELATLLGTPGWLPLAQGDARPLAVRFQYEQLLDSMQRVHPRILAARSRETAADSGISLARKARLPIPELEMGWWNAQAPTPNLAGALFVGISVPTLVFDRGQGLIARANAQAIQAAFEREAATAETHTELQRALSVLHHLQFTLDIYEQRIRERLPRLRQMAEEGYEAGEIRILELLDAINIFVEPQLDYLELLEAVMHAEIDVLSAAGMVEAHIDW